LNAEYLVSWNGIQKTQGRIMLFLIFVMGCVENYIGYWVSVKTITETLSLAYVGRGYHRKSYA